MLVDDCAASLVLLPGTLCDWRVFRPMLQALERYGTDTRHAVVIDTSHATTLEDAALQVLLKAPPTFSLLGFSLGGLIALQAALLAPERVQALALLGTTAAPVPVERHPARRASVAWARGQGTGTHIKDHLWPACVGQAKREDAALRNLLCTMADDLGPELFHAQTELAITRPDLRPLLRALTLPTLVLGGTHDDINPPTIQQELADALGDATLVLVENAGHFMLLEQPDEVAKHVAAWLNQVAQPAREFNDQNPNGKKQPRGCR